MSKVLITGGNGMLGRALTPRLIEAGYTVRISSRSPRPDTARPDVEWAQASLETGEGLEEAVKGVEIILHCITDASKPQKVDVEGTRRLLEVAKRHPISNFFYISIIGVDKVPFKYYAAKYEAEQLIEASGVPYTILRAPQFHEFVDMVLKLFTKLPVGFIPKGWRHQPMAVDEVADHMVELVKQGAQGHVPDIAGPHSYEAIELAQTWLAAQGKHKPLLQIPFWGASGAGMRAGYATAPDKANGGQTWESWLQKQYG